MTERQGGERLWVFGYGSLIWSPEFPVADRQVARVQGWHRSFCMWSIHYRGSVQSPGLVLALDRRDDAWCDGIAFAVTEGEEDAAIAALRERELISSAYEETWLPVVLGNGESVQALAYVINPNHDQYCGMLPLEEQARIIAGAAGVRGPNRDYLFSTTEHLETLGIADPDLAWLSARVRQIGDTSAA
ncbi:MAG: gamma-glutamylcyclotransferase [Cereibacter sphaeroides]|uniref:glutathione-specific gamma-glutamylcyclotransferase n=1 Tax=Cereibacter sphaeroides TaxID=1063 RepID=A0A2W5TY41_CERSP|nr:MAG: gamma-glutamylcyclotransferase [Cereibacter sphaeroides]